jgi:hypothetical protein
MLPRSSGFIAPAFRPARPDIANDFSVDAERGLNGGPHLAGLGRSKFLYCAGNRTESKPTRMAFAGGRMPQDVPCHV